MRKVAAQDHCTTHNWHIEPPPTGQCLENVHSQNSSRSQNVSVKLVSTSCKSVPFLFHLLLPGTSLDLSPLRAASKFVTKPLRFNSQRILFRQFMESCPVMSTFLRLNLRRGEMDKIGLKMLQSENHAWLAQLQSLAFGKG